MSETVNTRAEYALYWLAMEHPDVFADVQRWSPAMLAENQPAIKAAKAALADERGELEAERDALRALLKEVAADRHRLRHTGAFEACKYEPCVRARETLGDREGEQ